MNTSRLNLNSAKASLKLLLLLSLLLPGSLLAQFTYVTNNGALVKVDETGKVSPIAINGEMMMAVPSMISAGNW
jgi:hypothetical protein